MQIGNTASFTAAGFDSLLLPQQGQTAEGRTIWGFTVEQLSASGGELVLIPALIRPLSTVGVRERLLQAARQEREVQPPRPSPVRRAADGQPLPKVRKAVSLPVTAESVGKTSGLSILNHAIGLTDQEAPLSDVAESEQPATEDRKSGTRSRVVLPPLPHPRTAEDVNLGKVFHSALETLLDAGASGADLLELFQAHCRWSGTPSPSAFHAGFLVAVFEFLPALRERPDDRLMIGRALGQIRRDGLSHLSPSSLAQVQRALVFMATANTVAPDLIAQLLLDANTTGGRETNKATGEPKPRNQFTQNSGVRGFAQPMVEMFLAQSRQADIEIPVLCETAHALGRMFAQDTRKPTGASLFMAALGSLPQASSTIAKVRSAFDDGRTGRSLATAPAPSKKEMHQDDSGPSASPSEEGGEVEVASSGIVRMPGGSPSGLPPLIPWQSVPASLRSSSSSSSSLS